MNANYLKYGFEKKYSNLPSPSVPKKKKRKIKSKYTKINREQKIQNKNQPLSLAPEYFKTELTIQNDPTTKTKENDLATQIDYIDSLRGNWFSY